VDSRPDLVLPVKFPSGEVWVQEITPCEFQKMVVLEPRGTESGTAQIAAAGLMVGMATDVVAIVVGEIVIAGFVEAVGCILAAATAAGNPVLYPFSEHIPSKIYTGIF